MHSHLARHCGVRMRVYVPSTTGTCVCHTGATTRQQLIWSQKQHMNRNYHSVPADKEEHTESG